MHFHTAPGALAKRLQLFVDVGLGQSAQRGVETLAGPVGQVALSQEASATKGVRDNVNAPADGRRAHSGESTGPPCNPRPKPIRPQHLLLLQVDADLCDKFVGQHLGK